MGLALLAAAEHLSPAELTGRLRRLSPRAVLLRLGPGRSPMIGRGCSPSNMSVIIAALNMGQTGWCMIACCGLYQPADFAGKLVILGDSDPKRS